MLYLIYTTDTQNQIGTECLFQKTCKEDKDYFKALTLKYHNVIMGRKTFDSLQKPLKERRNIVLSKSNNSVFEEGYFTDKVSFDPEQDYIIAGGKEIYELFWDKVDVVYHTIHKQPDFGGIKFEPDYSKFALFEKSESEDLIKEIWVRQPYKDLPVEFNNSSRFPRLKREVGKYIYFTQQITATCLENHGIRHTILTQIPSLHKFNDNKDICIREELKAKGLVKSGEYWDKEGKIICEGCMSTNHSEYLAVQKAKYASDLNGGTCYLYGHYWSCQNCQEALKSIGIRRIVMCKDFVKNFLNI